MDNEFALKRKVLIEKRYFFVELNFEFKGDYDFGGWWYGKVFRKGEKIKVRTCATNDELRLYITLGYTNTNEYENVLIVYDKTNEHKIVLKKHCKEF